MIESESSPSWFGWLWTGDAWERVCDGDTIGECSRRLSEQARRRGIDRADKYSCLTGGGCPSFIPYDALQVNLCDAKGISVEVDL